MVNGKVNPLCVALLDQLADIASELAAQPSGERPRVVVVAGNQRAFAAGADITEFAARGGAAPVELADRDAVTAVGQSFLRALNAVAALPCPTIAAVNGVALGGGLELALACDVRFAAKTAKLGLPEVSLGIIPGYGGTQRLPRLCGTGAALHLILTGAPVTADEALRIGLVNGLAEPAELMAHCKAVALLMVSRGPQALALAKQAVRRGVHMPMADALQLESDLFGIVSSTAEFKEGMTAFLEKRKPSWLRA